jgi:hypothetical protein
MQEKSFIFNVFHTQHTVKNPSKPGVVIHTAVLSVQKAEAGLLEPRSSRAA